MSRQLGLICLLALMLPASLANGQPPGNAAAFSVFPPAPRALRQNLARAKKAIEEERFSDAVAELGELLGGTELPDGQLDDESQDFFVESTTGNGTQTSLKSEAQQLLGSLPPKGRELFELRYGADARRLLDGAVQQADLNQLNEVVRKYFHTPAGYEAALLLGRLHLDHGRPLAGALCLQRVAQIPNAAAKYEPELSLLLATCWRQAGQDGAAEDALRNLARKPFGETRIGDEAFREIPGGASREWLQARVRPAAGPGNDLDQWPLFRGNPARTGAHPSGLPLRRARWQVPMLVDEHDRSLVREIQGSFIDQGWPVLPVLQPLAVGNIVLVRSAERLIGVDFETGKRVWEYPWWDLSQAEETRPSTPQMAPENRRELRSSALRERLWQDVAYGHVSSDGQAVYLLDGQRQPAELLQGMRWNRARGIGFPMDSPPQQNELVALDLKREGYLLWKVGGETGGEEPKLAGALFLGAPLPLFGQLHAIAELKGELRLVVLDAATGQQLWSQQLAHLDASWGSDEQLRRLSGVTPSFADGVLVCPTSAGAVVAVDLATRTLLWGFQYLTSKETFGRNGFMQPFAMQQPANPNRWQDSCVTIAEGVVLVTPVDEEVLICLDLLTGQPKWKLPRNGELSDMLFVGTVRQGQAIIVGKERAVAISLANGKTTWNLPLRSGAEPELPSGRGIASGDFYFLPTTESSLLKIDLAAGRIVERVPTDQPLGNLISFHDEIVSVSAERAATFYQLEPLRKSVDQRLRENPVDAWALARLGELQVQEGKTNEALETLRRAHQRNPQDDGVNSLLVETFLAAVGKDYAAHAALAPEVEPLIVGEEQRTRYLLLRAIGEQQRGNLVLAAEGFAELASRVLEAANKLPAEDSFAMLAVSPGLTVRADRYLAARFAELFASADSAARERVEKLARELAARVKPDARSDYRHFLQVFGLLPAADDVRLRYGDLLVRDGEWLAAEQALWPLASRNTSRPAGAAWALLSMVYGNGRSPRMVASCREQLTKHWAETEIWDGKTGRYWSDAANGPTLLSPAIPGSAATNVEWTWGAVQFQETRDVARQSILFQPCLPVVERRGDALAGLKVVFDFSKSSTYLRDGNGLTAFRLPHIESRLEIDPGLWKTAADGHVFFSVMSGQLVAVDTLRMRPNEPETVLWRESLFAVGNDGPKAADRLLHSPLEATPLVTKRWVDAGGRGIASVGPLSAQGVCFQKVRSVTCLDPRSGQLIWNRSDLEAGSELFGDHEYVFVLPPTPASGRSGPPGAANANGVVEATAIRIQDGRLEGKKRLPSADRRWTTRGRHVLAWEVIDKRTRLILVDAATEQELWSEPFAEGSRGTLVENEFVAVVQPDGKYFLRSLHDAQTRLAGQLDPITGLTSVHVIPSRNEFLLVVNDSQAANPEGLDFGRRPNRQQPLPVNGRIYSLNRVTGEANWQVPAMVRGFSALPEQPADLPTLWLVRSRITNAATSANVRLDILCLDRRTGAVLLLKNDVATQFNTFDVSADPRKQEVTLSLQGVQITARFTNEPRPPAPPAQLNRENNRVDSALERFGDFMESVKDALVP